MILRRLIYIPIVILVLAEWSCTDKDASEEKAEDQPTTSESSRTNGSAPTETVVSSGIGGAPKRSESAAGKRNIGDKPDPGELDDEEKNGNASASSATGGTTGLGDEAEGTEEYDAMTSTEDGDAGDVDTGESGSGGGTSDGTGGTSDGTGGTGGTALSSSARVVLLHHSTGEVVWEGGVLAWFQNYNATHDTSYQITEQTFPKDDPYGWNNYPYDYWNIWVEHAGNEPFADEPTLEILTQQYDVISFKHCFPVSDVQADYTDSDVSSQEKTISNYKLQYNALRTKLRSFPNNRFIVWTGAALTADATNEQNAQRARTFFKWVVNDWDEPGDNVFIWDFRSLETGGSDNLYMLDEHAEDIGNPHPNSAFAQRVAPLFGQRVVNVIEGLGDSTDLTGQ